MYAEWAAEDSLTPSRFTAVTDLETFKREASCHVVTPGECIALCERLGPTGRLHWNPLMGGLDPQFAWDSLNLFEKRVLPKIKVSRTRAAY
jgi:hypothetical protein